MTAQKYLQLAPKLKRLLFDHDMKVADLARKVNLPQPTLHRLVTGKSTRPYPSSLKPIADYFSVSVEELLGETQHLDQAWDNKADKLVPTSAITHKIPVVKWRELGNLQTAHQQSQEHIISMGHLSEETFAVTLPDSSMEPLFPAESLLILDPKQEIKDRCYVLVYLKETETYLFRQLLTDGENQHLKPLNPDLNVFKMRTLQEGDEIIACLIEARKAYL